MAAFLKIHVGVNTLIDISACLKRTKSLTLTKKQTIINVYVL